MNKNNLYIHIGPPKTATTSFQKFFLNNTIKGLSYGGIIQPRISTDESYCKLLYKATCSNDMGDYKRNESKSENVVCSEEMFLVDSKSLKWQDKIKNLYSLTKDQKTKIILVLREPNSAIRSYYQELYFNLDKNIITSINEFSKSNYCKIYNYEYLLDYLRNVGFEEIIILDFKTLITGDYKLADIFDLDSEKKISLERSNTSVINSDVYYANNPSLKKYLSAITPKYLRENVFLRPLKRILSYFIPDIKITKSKKINVEIDKEIISEFEASYKRVKSRIVQ